MQARRLFVFLYVASGSAALVYQVAWTRLLTLQLGHTVAAASTVLAAFMGGLALGAWLAGRLLARDGLKAVPRLHLYAGLELAVAATALALPLALGASVPALAWAYADGSAPARFALVRVAISLVTVGVPAVAMGATFPIAADWYGRASADAGVLYAANTAGAAIGAIAAGFFLIPAFGLRATTWVGVALNLAAAAGAWWIARARLEPGSGEAKQAQDDASRRRPERKRSSKSPTEAPPLRPLPALACSAVAISGFAALVYEVAWTRLLALVIGPTTYAFATMAAAFIGGLAVGSAIGTRVARRSPQPAVWLAALLVAGAIAAVAAAWLAATRLPLVIAAHVADPAVAFNGVVAAHAVAVGVLLLPMTAALGATFPLALAVAAGSATTSGGIGKAAAQVYAANTAGAIAGALCAGFLLIPWLGLSATFDAAALLAAAAGAGCLALAMRTIAWPASVATAALACIVLLPPWDRELLASGAYKYAPSLASGDLDALLRAGRLEYYKEGAAGTVSVKRVTGKLSLAIDGKVDASNGADMLNQRLAGLLPVLLHGRAREICIVGLGSGVTVGSALAAGGVRHADVVEISPEVVEASRLFDRESGRALAQPGVRLILGDGRSHVLLTPRRYDVIVSEPSNPWMSGVASLFTREFFLAARARLKPDGLLCQWAHTYDIGAADLQSIVRTFASVFPQGTMWLVGEGDLLLIGTAGEPVAPYLERMAREWRVGTASAELTSVGVADAAAPFALLSLFAGGPRELERYGGSATVQTDDHTPLEYSAPRAMYDRTQDHNAAAIRALGAEPPAGVRDLFERADAAAWTSRGIMLLKAQAFAPAYDAFRQAVTLDSKSADALAGLSDAAGGSNRLLEEREWLQALAGREPGNAAVRIELSRVLAVTGDLRGAAQAASDAVRLAPDDPRAAEQLASVFADAGDVERLAPLADAMRARFPDRVEPRYYHATALYLRGRTQDAVVAARQVIGARPEHARAHSLLGAACAMLGERDCVREAFLASIRINPRDPSPRINLGALHLQSGDPRAAAESFAEALVIDPRSVPARQGLAEARAAAPKND